MYYVVLCNVPGSVKSAFAGMRKARGSRRLTEPETPAMRLADRAGLSKSEVAQMEKFLR